MPSERPVEVIKGIIERVAFHNTENGFCVLQVMPERSNNTVVVIGSVATANPGEWLYAEGHWMYDRVHGRQFRADFLQISPPCSLAGMERFLSSGLIRGIGPVYAKKLVAKFGEQVLEIIDKESGRLSEVTGIGLERRRRIKAAWREQQAIRNVMLFLYSHGVGTTRAVRIFKTYGDSAIAKLKEDPYRLARDIPGIGFKTADDFARKIGIPEDSPLRAAAAVEHVLMEAAGDGHTHLPQQVVEQSAAQLIKVPTTQISSGIGKLQDSGALVQADAQGVPCLWLPALDRAERLLAKRVVAFSERQPPWPATAPEAVARWCEQRLKTILSEGQRVGLATCLASAISIITGGPGVGKTTLVRSLAAILQSKGMRLRLCAPTGRAARRLGEATADLGLNAVTIHRLLGAYHSGFERGPLSPLDCDVVVADEASMIDLPLMNRLFGALPDHAALILVGDADQLPSVGPGRVLHDLIESTHIPVARLNTIFRQAAGSRIVHAAHKVNSGEIPELEPDSQSDFFFIAKESPEEIGHTVLELVTRRIPRRLGVEPKEGVQVLTPMNRGEIGVHALNRALQNVLTPATPTTSTVQRFGWEFRVGDKIMQTENDHTQDLSNGDLGRVVHINHDEQILEADFDGRQASYPFEELDALCPAYAVTIHKAQGSEFPAVVIPLATQHFVMLRRNLLYTAITRGRRLVVVVGQRRALEYSIRNADGPHSRRSALLERIHQLLPS